MNKIKKMILPGVVLFLLACNSALYLFYQRGVDISCLDSFVYAKADKQLQIIGNFRFWLHQDHSGYSSVSGTVEFQGEKYVLSRKTQFRYTSAGKNTLKLYNLSSKADAHDTLPANFSSDKFLASLFFHPPAETIITVRQFRNSLLLGNISSAVMTCTV